MQGDEPLSIAQQVIKGQRLAEQQQRLERERLAEIKRLSAEQIAEQHRQDIQKWRDAEQRRTAELHATTQQAIEQQRIKDEERFATVRTIEEERKRVEQRLCDARQTALEERAKRGRDSRHIPQWMRQLVWDRDGGVCVEGGETEFLQYDHIIPWSRGGATTPENLRLLCKKCNLKKSNKI
jgi:5-methylcytosine-specific restriction endonuclease McrA